MNILTISGSVRRNSRNDEFLRMLPKMFTEHHFVHSRLSELPLFYPEIYESDVPVQVKKWKEAIKPTDLVVISTPEYLHNIPAVLKNAFEWLTQTGELVQKKVLPITFTPHHPRGKKAMQSLIWTLQALDAQIVTTLELYHSDFLVTNDLHIKGETKDMLKTAFEFCLK